MSINLERIDLGRKIQQVLGTRPQGFHKLHQIKQMLRDCGVLDPESTARKLGFNSLEKLLESEHFADYIEVKRQFPVLLPDGTQKRANIYKARLDDSTRRVLEQQEEYLASTQYRNRVRNARLQQQKAPHCTNTTIGAHCCHSQWAHSSIEGRRKTWYGDISFREDILPGEEMNGETNSAFGSGCPRDGSVYHDAGQVDFGRAFAAENTASGNGPQQTTASTRAGSIIEEFLSSGSEIPGTANIQRPKSSEKPCIQWEEDDDDEVGDGDGLLGPWQNRTSRNEPRGQLDAILDPRAFPPRFELRNSLPLPGFAASIRDPRTRRSTAPLVEDLPIPEFAALKLVDFGETGENCSANVGSGSDGWMPELGRLLNDFCGFWFSNGRAMVKFADIIGICPPRNEKDLRRMADNGTLVDFLAFYCPNLELGNFSPKKTIEESFFRHKNG